MILENNQKTFQELQNRIIGKILNIIASSLEITALEPQSHVHCQPVVSVCTVVLVQGVAAIC